MPEGTQSEGDIQTGSESEDRPQITVCESCPDKAIFIESGNTDGWIASDLTVDVDR